VETLKDRVIAELGVSSDAVVTVELYKLLLYQEGDHFMPHRDTEKADGMFATMIILLPSQYLVRCCLCMLFLLDLAPRREHF